MNTNHIESAGRDWLVVQLRAAGFAVEYPDDGDPAIDMIVWTTDPAGRLSVRCPIQMKASSGRTFTVHRKYEMRPDLLHVFVWHVMETDRTEAYALTYGEATRVAEAMCWTETDSWLTGAGSGSPGYGTTHPGKRLLALLEPHRMTAVRWREKVIAHGTTRV